MPHEPDLAKRELWRERLEQFAQGKERIVDFCRRVGVPVWSFYYWQQRLRPAAKAQASDGQPTVKVASRRKTRLTRPNRRARTARLNFVPVQITGGRNVEVHLPKGTRMTVPCQEHDAIRAVILALLSALPEPATC